MPMALRDARVWGTKERMIERAVATIEDDALFDLVEATQICDGVVKGLRHPMWPHEPWAALRHLTSMVCERISGSATWIDRSAGKFARV